MFTHRLNHHVGVVDKILSELSLMLDLLQCAQTALSPQVNQLLVLALGSL